MRFKLPIFDILIAMRSNLADMQDCKQALIKSIERTAYRGMLDLSLRTLCSTPEDNDSMNRFLWGDIENLAESLKDNPVVTYLDLSEHNMTDEGVILLVKVLQNNSILRSLSLKNNQITDKGAVLLLQALENNKALCYLELYQNKISPENISAINKCLLRNLYYNQCVQIKKMMDQPLIRSNRRLF